MPFVPPQFSDLGKKAKDLLSKKYDFKNEIKTTNKADGGLTIESGAKSAKTLDAYVKGTYKDSTFGSCEAEIHTAGTASDTKGKVTFDKFADGVCLSISGSSAATGEAEATYKQESLATKLKIKGNQSAIKADVEVSAGVDGYSAGVSVNTDLSNGFALKDYNIGAEAVHGDLVAAIKTQDSRQGIAASVYQKVANDLLWGGSLLVGLGSSSARVLTLGFQYDLDKACILKTRANSEGLLGTVVEHKVKDQFQFAISAEYDLTKPLGAPAEKFGIAMAFGDF